LLEDYRIATIAVPQLLLEQGVDNEASRVMTSDSMLLVGNIDFSGPSGELSDSLMSLAAPSRSLDGKQMTWQSLPGTQAEIESIRETIEQQNEKTTVRILTGAGATESALRQQVPDARWLHFATHGFFADVEAKGSLNHQVSSRSLDATVLGRESIPGFDPGLLTGLVFSGANRVPEPGSDDGILTAVEISEMDLTHVEMTVMSACETGLGESLEGEGVLGLQRSLQLAGCRSVVASLWKVDDQATSALMQQFYHNVWTKKLGKLEALRQAQISMLRRYDWQAGTLRGDKRLSPTKQRGDDFSQTPPAYWAAFVLSGDCI
jgi:CHAT domain-containing protein